ncbi:MAG: hypothetical protein J0I29_02220 [Rhizobiales bacterium]|nr:hypothetical protein [Hyphomicrobiales bacterium]
MFERIGQFSAYMPQHVMTAALIVAIAAPSTTASSQQQQPPAQQQLAPAQSPPEPSPPPAPQPAERSNPGLVEEIGKLLKDSATGIKDSATGLTSKLPSARDTLDGINNTAKGASDSLPRLPSLSGQTVTGRSICPPAGNGAPDCKIASDLLCKEKGYKEGRSVDIETSQKCSAKDYLAGRGACRTENFVTGAVCQ